MDNVPDLFAGLRRTAFFDHCDRAMSAEEVADLALEELRIAGSCLVVCNTRAMAERIYGLCAAAEEASRYYLSTNLCPAHRLEKLAAMRAELDEKQPVLCVSTQLIECGVDISFGSVIRFAAGLDSILQAAGRGNRHGENLLGRVHVVRARQEDERLDTLIDIREGRAVFLDAVRVGLADILKASGNDFTRPDIIASYFEHYFYRRGNVMAYPQGDNNETLLNMLGSNRNVPGRKPLVCYQSFAEAARLFHPIDSPAQTVVVPHGEGEAIIADLCSTALFHRRKELLRKAQRYSVNVFPNTMRRLASQNALHDIQSSGILSLHTAFYCPETGVVTQPHGKHSRTYVM